MGGSGGEDRGRGDRARSGRARRRRRGCRGHRAQRAQGGALRAPEGGGPGPGPGAAGGRPAQAGAFPGPGTAFRAGRGASVEGIAGLVRAAWFSGSGGFGWRRRRVGKRGLRSRSPMAVRAPLRRAKQPRTMGPPSRTEPKFERMRRRRHRVPVRAGPPAGGAAGTVPHPLRVRTDRGGSTRRRGTGLLGGLVPPGVKAATGAGSEAPDRPDRRRRQQTWQRE